jgi:DNA-binding protein H-NS
LAKTYVDVQKQIEALQQEAEKLKRKEIEGVIGRIREAIATYGLTAHDLGLANGRGPRRTAAAPRMARKNVKAKSGAIKFRDENGNTWGGRGPRPQWLRSALSAGKQLNAQRQPRR